MASTLNLITKKGDTFKRTDFQVIINENPLNLTNAEVKIQLRKQPGGIVYLEPLITIFDPTNGEFCIDEQIIDIEAYDYKYDIQITTENGEVNTWVSGLFTIINDITR